MVPDGPHWLGDVVTCGVAPRACPVEASWRRLSSSSPPIEPNPPTAPGPPCRGYHPGCGKEGQCRGPGYTSSSQHAPRGCMQLTVHGFQLLVRKVVPKVGVWSTILRSLVRHPVPHPPAPCASPTSAATKPVKWCIGARQTKTNPRCSPHDRGWIPEGDWRRRLLPGWQERQPQPAPAVGT